MSLSRLCLLFVLIFNLLVYYSCKKDSPSDVQKEQFIKLFGGPYTNEGIDLIEDAGSFVLIGNQYNQDNISSILVVKTDDFGNRVWEKELSYQGFSTVASQLIKLEKQEGYAIIGTAETDEEPYYSDMILYILDLNGEIKTEKIYNNTNHESGKCLMEFDSGDLMLTATSDSTSTASAKEKLFFKVTTTGDTTIRTISRSAADVNFTGISYSKNSDFIYITGKGNNQPEINVLMKKDFTVFTVMDFDPQVSFNGITQDTAGNIYVCGTRNSGANVKKEIFVAKLTFDGSDMPFSWQKEIGFNGDDMGTSISISQTNHLIITGSTQDVQLSTYNVYIAELALLDGNIIQSTTFGGARNEFGVKSVIDATGKTITLGTSSFNSSSLISLMKLNWE
ncbi:MAG: hypothetical protein WCX31_18395 [Salinivirgaceae bacterium]